ncbi:MAG: SDR family oxidoreductase [Archaeoglobaceae archaeon]
MRIVITGGCGFIGSNLTEELSGDNEVVILDNLATGSVDNIKGLDVEFVEGDVTDLDLLQDMFQSVDYVLHQAAVVSVPESIKDPLKTNEVNARGTLNVLLAARDNGVRKVVNASSCAVYGDTDELPISEDVTPNPKSPYAVTKLTAEYYCNVFTELYGLGTVSLRYFNVYGPRQDPQSDYAAAIPKFITKVLKGGSPVIFGDGEQTRDFVYVKDVVKANIMAMEGEESGIFNVATGRKVSVNELASLIIELSGNDLSPVYDEPREGDIMHSYGDASRIKEAMGFEASYGIEEGLRETMGWFKEWNW